MKLKAYEKNAVILLLINNLTLKDTQYIQKDTFIIKYFAPEIIPVCYSILILII